MPEPAAWGALGTVLTAVLLYLGARFTASQSARVADRANNNQRRKDEYERLGDYTDRLEKRFDSLEGRVQTLEQQLDRTQRLLKSALAYIERLLDFITDHMPGAEDVPQPPSNLHQHLGVEVVDNWRAPPSAAPPGERSDVAD